VATHDPMLIDLADRVIELRDGRLLDDGLATADADAADPRSAETAGLDERGSVD